MRAAEIHNLEFKTPQIHPGLNVTVRNGRKWFDKVQPGDTVLCVETGKDDFFALGRVLLAVAVNRDEIPSEWLRFEHASGARTQKGLRKAMEAAYGPKYGPEVTVLFFWV